MIEKEINGDWSNTNWHNCDLKRCLIRPKRRKILFGVGIKEVWVVLEECSEMKVEPASACSSLPIRMCEVNRLKPVLLSLCH